MRPPKLTIADPQALADAPELITLTLLARITGRSYDSLRYAAWAQQTEKHGPLLFPVVQPGGPDTTIFVRKADVVSTDAKMNGAKP